MAYVNRIESEWRTYYYFMPGSTVRFTKTVVLQKNDYCTVRLFCVLVAHHTRHCLPQIERFGFPFFLPDENL